MLNTSITTAHCDLADVKLRQGFLAPCSSPAKLEQQIQLLMLTMSIWILYPSCTCMVEPINCLRQHCLQRRETSTYLSFVKPDFCS